ncbi:hypothetical protein GCM10008983_07770 [Lentibacillus halophilus]|uniref:Uncharacterized protein n=1 Tax=Lentibacillus halophilus TaxID=295065 RepID=A0ABN0Z4V6_9BACI
MFSILFNCTSSLPYRFSEKVITRMFNKQYTFIKIEELPVFIAFDTKVVAIKTNNDKKIIKFLQE